MWARKINVLHRSKRSPTEVLSVDAKNGTRDIDVASSESATEATGLVQPKTA
jgi:hypothetical protein